MLAMGPPLLAQLPLPPAAGSSPAELLLDPEETLGTSSTVVMGVAPTADATADATSATAVSAVASSAPESADVGGAV